MYARSEDALWHRTSRRTLVNPAGEASTFELDGIPALVWEALAEPVTLDELVDDLAAIFDQRRAVVRTEVERVLAGLEAAGAVPSG